LQSGGLLIRHLVLPNNLAGSERVVDFVVDEISKDTYINIMDQYYPAYRANEYNELNRIITNDEFEKVIEYARKKRFDDRVLS
jgi:putative pyruvate formate lyase activating enzyme